MKVEIKNSDFNPTIIRPLYQYFQSLNSFCLWEFKGLKVELDPVFDFKNDDVLIRWTEIFEGFNDKIIIHSLSEFTTSFKLIS